MAHQIELMVFGFFVERKRKLTLEDLEGRFAHTSVELLFALASNLVAKRLLDEDPLNLAWTLSSRSHELVQQAFARTK